jgi:hypothetical protein
MLPSQTHSLSCVSNQLVWPTVSWLRRKQTEHGGGWGWNGKDNSVGDRIEWRAAERLTSERLFLRLELRVRRTC